MSKVYIIGMGPGGTAYLSERAKNIILNCRFFAGSSRLIRDITHICYHSDMECHIFQNTKTCLQWIDDMQTKGDVCVPVSGDVHYYSLAKTILDSSYEWDIMLVSGISAYQMMADRMGITLENVRLCSMHGRNESDGYAVYQVAKNREVMFLCSKNFPPERIAKALCHYGYDECLMYIGSNLCMEQEELLKMDASMAAFQTFCGMSVVYVYNKMPENRIEYPFLKDEEFIRGKVPMTKQEIRILLMQKIAPKEWDCLWDLGAGTGSVSIEMARRACFGKVCSVEYKEEAVKLIQKNKEKFQCRNLDIFQERIGSCIDRLPDPDCVFLGGSEGELSLVVSHLKKLPKKIHFVMTAVTLETLSEATALFSDLESFRYMQIQIGHSTMVGKYHTMSAAHPIWILEVDL